MKKNKRILFLLGAGAAYHWFDKSKGISAKTDDITRKMVNDICFCKVLYKHLKQKLPVVNFETLVNAIENLALHYYGLRIPVDYDHSIIFEPSDWIENYFKTRDNESISIRLVDIYKRCIEIIIKMIKSYDLNIKVNKSKNESLKNFICFAKSQDYILRAYTLNYDQMFIDVCKDTPIEFIDGFEKTEFLVDPYIIGSSDYIYEFSPNQVINEINKNCFYNLHGSIFWHWKHSPLSNSAKSQFLKTSQYFGGCFDWQSINIDTLKESNINERIINAPIITGFKKLQRMNIEPFNAISNTFYRDCHSADVVVFIGYSFGDSHINSVLSSANITDKEILIVDYNLQKDKKNYKLESIIGSDFNDIIDNGVNKKGNIRYFSEGITDFLELEQYKTVESFF
ncbi:MAG: SIR2 family protein [Candidatus Delongbacteria bacterium]|nr:SIR2 family protein [Candidatus Delongbacteria bacterium]